MLPMLATAGRLMPSGAGWAHEVKWDGMRVVAHTHGPGGGVELHSRTERDVTVAFPEVVIALAGSGLPRAVFDGEVVRFREGVPVFGALGERIHVSSGKVAADLAAVRPVSFVIFDLLSFDGLAITALPWQERRQALEALALPTMGSLAVPPTYDDGSALRQATLAQGLEGVVSKRRDATYRPGVRSEAWLKFPHRSTQTWVVGGWRPQVGSTRLGAVLVGREGPEGLVYAGRVGSGLAGKASERLKALLEPVDGSPFAQPGVPEVDARGTFWVAPKVCVEVASLGYTTGGRLRQPSFLGVRGDG